MPLTKTQTLEKYITKLGILKPFLHLYYQKLIKKELTLTTINETDKILFIGAGAMPLSAIYLKKYTGADVTIIDNNKTMMDNALTYLKKQNTNITCQCCDGQYIDLKAYTVIFIANQVSPKQHVLKHILINSSPQTKVFIRGTLTTPINIAIKRCKHRLTTTKFTNLLRT